MFEWLKQMYTEVTALIKPIHLFGDSKSHNSDVHTFDYSNFVIELINITCRYSVRDEDDNAINAWPSSIVIAEYFQTRNLEATGRVRVLAEISNVVNGRQHVGFRRVVVQVEV